MKLKSLVQVVVAILMLHPFKQKLLYPKGKNVRRVYPPQKPSYPKQAEFSILNRKVNDFFMVIIPCTPS